jgi:hypothetical protein
MISLIEILKERKQVGDVYHFTAMKSLFNILDSNLLKSYHSTVSFSSGKMTGYQSSVSTTRDKNFIKSRYKRNTAASIMGDSVALVLDGNAMSDRFKTIPYDDAYVPDQDPEDYERVKKAMGDEMEQLWYGPEIERGGINNIRKYIKRIIITKKFQNSLLNADFALYKTFSSEFINQVGHAWSFETSPQLKLKQIQEFIETKYNIPVEIEK